MEITEGWSFHSADFSRQSANPWMNGEVMLVRNVESVKKWHRMPDEIKESGKCPPLYVTGWGKTIEEAIQDACVKAERADPVPEFTQVLPSTACDALDSTPRMA